jgi:hypothetical protein
VTVIFLLLPMAILLVALFVWRRATDNLTM